MKLKQKSQVSEGFDEESKVENRQHQRGLQSISKGLCTRKQKRGKGHNNNRQGSAKVIDSSDEI